jgi:hypothetical protein
MDCFGMEVLETCHPQLSRRIYTFARTARFNMTFSQLKRSFPRISFVQNDGKCGHRKARSAGDVS